MSLMARLSVALLLLSASILVCASPAAHPGIKHVIVVMFENRAFDHLLGWYQNSSTPVNGLNPSMFNYVNDANTSSGKVFAVPNATYILDCDPDHSVPGTLAKVFDPSTNFTPGQRSTMGGFVTYEDKKNPLEPEYCNVMRSFTPEDLPIISTLAAEFTLMDRFFASVPGPTWPNRAFFLSGTSMGLTETDTWYANSTGLLFPSRTILDQVASAGGEWKIYYNDTPWELFMETIAHNTDHLFPTEQLWEDARNGNLPDFAFINPRCGVNMTTGEGAMDQHPVHDVALGERALKDIYEAIRSSPQWNETLLIVTYDEHGGFYDHVPIVTSGVPAPDNSTSYPDPGFTFEMLGVRVPTILISPWAPKGLVVSDAPPAQKPFLSSEYDLTSIMASVRKILPIFTSSPADAQPLTRRDAWSSTFEHVFNLSAPRWDCPLHLPQAPLLSLSPHVEAGLPVTGLQTDILAAHAHAAHVPFPHHIKTQGEVSPWLATTFQIHHETTQRWRLSKDKKKRNVDLTLSMKPISKDLVAADSFAKFNISTSKSLPSFITISAKIHLNESSPRRLAGDDVFCMHADIEALSVDMSYCYPTAEASHNRDQSQHFLLTDDSTIRPVLSPDLCLSTNVLVRGGDNVVFLAPCSASNGVGLGQHLSYFGEVPGWLGTKDTLALGTYGMIIG
jgi:phospholipase C